MENRSGRQSLPGVRNIGQGTAFIWRVKSRAGRQSLPGVWLGVKHQFTYLLTWGVENRAGNSLYMECEK